MGAQRGVVRALRRTSLQANPCTEESEAERGLKWYSNSKGGREMAGSLTLYSSSKGGREMAQPVS